MASLNELYRKATGMTQYDLEEKISYVNSYYGNQEKAEFLKKILFYVPGGIGGSNYDDLRKAISEEMSYIGDFTGDKKITKEDVSYISSYVGTTETSYINTYDIDKDGDVDANDVSLVENLSIAEVETEETPENNNNEDNSENKEDVEE